MSTHGTSLSPHYDIAIIGAGPAGLCAANRIQKTSGEASVLLVDRVAPWEKPIACAEGAGRLGLHEAIEVDPQWIRFLVSNAEFHAPGGGTIKYSDSQKGYIIDRARMQKDLAKRAEDNGIDCRFGLSVTRVGAPEKGFRPLKFASGPATSARVVIDASGPLSRIGAQEKLPWKSKDLEPSYFAVVKNLHFATDTIHIYMAKNLAPGGYAWVFPREHDTANIGIVIGSPQKGKTNIVSLLDTFLKERFPKGEVVGRYAGSIPCGCERRTLAIEGLIKSGDAAGTANPISRAGIVEAMISGNLAGDCALAMLGANDKKAMRSACRAYEKAWMEQRGDHHLKLARVKHSLARIPDSDYDRAAEALSDIPRDQLLMSKIFKLSLGRFPRLVWAMRHLL